MSLVHKPSYSFGERQTEEHVVDHRIEYHSRHIEETYLSKGKRPPRSPSARSLVLKRWQARRRRRLMLAAIIRFRERRTAG